MVIRRIAAIVIGCAVLTSAAYAADGSTHRKAGINARERRQAQRIRNGNKNGELTQSEKDKLKADEAAIRAEERVYRKSGDGLSPAERKDLEKDLNETSREIYRAK